MSYEYKFKIVRNYLMLDCKQRITDNWNKIFDMWLSCEADWEFRHAYENAFKGQFGQYINSEIENQLFISSRNLLFAIDAFLSYHDDAELQDVLHFTEIFVSKQLDDFHNWCGLYDKMPEDAQEMDDKNDENN